MPSLSAWASRGRGPFFILIGEIDWRGERIRVCSLERLREMKRAGDRPLDRLDLEALADAHGGD
jgi:hypothetical protein